MKNSRLTRSSNMGKLPAISNSIHGTTNSANLPKKEKYPQLTINGFFKLCINYILNKRTKII